MKDQQSDKGLGVAIGMLLLMDVGQRGSCERISPTAGKGPKKWVVGIVVPRSTTFLTIEPEGEDGKWTYWPDVREKSPLTYTLDQFNPGTPYCLYSGQPPPAYGARRNGFAHSKGLFHRAHNPTEHEAPFGPGLWIHHSVPEFPYSHMDGDVRFVNQDGVVNAKDNLGHAHGQHFAMIQLDAVDPNRGDGVCQDPIVDILAASWANVFYSHKQVVSFSAHLEYKSSLISAQVNKDDDSIVAFALHGQDGNNDFAGEIAKFLNVDLMCTAWPQGSQSDHFNFKPSPRVHNVRVKQMPDSSTVHDPSKYAENFIELSKQYERLPSREGPGKLQGNSNSENKPSFPAKLIWSDPQPDQAFRQDDHSKWCTADYGQIPWTCFLSLNRAVNHIRSGDAVCVRDKAMNRLFRRLVLIREVASDHESKFQWHDLGEGKFQAMSDDAQMKWNLRHWEGKPKSPDHRDNIEVQLLLPETKAVFASKAPCRSGQPRMVTSLFEDDGESVRKKRFEGKLFAKISRILRQRRKKNELKKRM
eukprot:m.17413 g.17413  ORF g.17413 m.17413 type:complete len:529 (+) comp5184_c0_seq1:52-1638(+)